MAPDWWQGRTALAQRRRRRPNRGLEVLVEQNTAIVDAPYRTGIEFRRPPA
jgi:hypothetical protein